MLGMKVAPMATDRVVLVATGNGHALSNSSRVVTGTPSKPGADPGATDFPRHSTPKDSKAQVTPVMLTPGGGHKVLSPVGRGVMTPDSHPGGEEGGKGPPGAPSAVTPVSTYSTVLLPWLALSRKDLEGSPSDLDYPGEAGQGSDPLMQTARGKLQTQRSKLNDQINRELRLRAGAENLYKATTNKKLRETVALELSYVNSNLQLLKEELADLNSSVLIYQNDSAINSVPMLPLGLKETKEMDFKPVLKEYISSHYHENSELYDSEIQDLCDIRQACRTPVRNESGIQLLYEYYNHLYFVEKRFFPPDRSLGLYFEWYDSLTGVPSAQRTVGFEKGSTLFNIAALYTQIGARQDRTKLDGVEKGIDCFQRAAGAFQYLQDNFSHAPSMDLQPPTLTMLIQLMLSQAQECIMERAMLEKPPSNIQGYLTAAQEAAKVAEMYAMCHGVMQEDPIKDYVPPSWVSMAEVKSQYFTSLAHHHTATAIIDLKDPQVSDLRQQFEKVHIEMNGTPSHSTSAAIETFTDRKTLGKAHLRQSILCLEEAMSLHSHSKQLRRIDTFQDILRAAHDQSLLQFSALEEEDDFSELMSAPPIRPHSAHSLNSLQPDFAKYKVDDLFRNLGLLAIFSARHSWTAPRELVLQRDAGQDYGFSVRGDSPVIIAMVEDCSLASKSGMKIGDFLVGVDEKDVKWSKHDEVVQLIRTAGLCLRLCVVSPIDRNYLDLTQGPSDSNLPRSGKESTENEMGLKQKKEKEEKTGSSWTLRRKGGSKEKQSKDLTNGDR